MPELDFGSSNLPFAISCAIDAAVVLGAVATRRWLALLAALAILGVKGLAMMAIGLNDFGVTHVLWLDLVVVLPAAGVLAFALTRRRAALLALLAVPVGVYGSFVEPGRLVTERATVALAPERAGSAPVRIGVLADLQFERVGDHEHEAVDRVLRARPDLIVLPGDYHQGTAESLRREEPAIRALLRRLRAPHGVYAVQGDAESVGALRGLLEGTGVRPLVNEARTLRVRDRRVVLGGVERTFTTDDARALIRTLETGRDGADVRLLLAHKPDVVLDLGPDTRIDLVVAGHTHGGQVQLPFLGPPITASRIPRDVAAGGLHALDGRRVYVSRGVGLERGQAPRLRLGAPPEVSILTLR